MIATLFNAGGGFLVGADGCTADSFGNSWKIGGLLKECECDFGLFCSWNGITIFGV